MSTQKLHLQSTIAAKVPQAFVLKTPEFVEVTASGIPPLDSLIQGFQRGGITEIYGPPSSGRTTIAIAFLAEITRQQQACAIVDAFDSLDPESLAAAGADLNRVLWVRCGNPQPGDSTLVAANANPELDQSRHSPTSLTTHRPLVLSSRHPRNEVRGLSHAVADLMGNESGNRTQAGVLGISPEIFREPASLTRDKSNREEQTSIDRVPPRRGDLILAKASAVPGQAQGVHSESGGHLPRARRTAAVSRQGGNSLTNCQTLWARLEQALKVTDLLLHNGGFGAVVMDLGDVPPANARRIPLASWFRFRRAIENTPTVFVLLTREPCAQTCASLVLRCERRRERWGHAGNSSSHSQRVTLDGLDLTVEIVRSRSLSAIQRIGGNPRQFNSTPWQTRMRWAE